LGDLADFEDAFVLADAEVVRHGNLPLGGLLTDVSDDDWLLSLVLDRHKAEVKLVGEVQHGAATPGPDRNDELLALGHHHQVISVVGLGLRREFDDVGDIHSGGDLGGHLVYL
jgi:hypothetical protein